MTPTVSRRAHLGVALALVAALVTLPAAMARAQDSGVLVRQVQLDDDGQTRITVSVGAQPTDADLTAADFAVTENGDAVDGLAVERLSGGETQAPVSIAILFDTSGSMAGQAMDDAIGAASNFVEQVERPGLTMALITFDSEAVLVAGPSQDGGVIVDAISGLEAAGETALFDAFLVGARTLQNLAGESIIVAFTDGADTASEATEQVALNAVTSADATAYGVALDTGDLDTAAIERIANASGGFLLTVENSAELTDAFTDVVTSLTNQYVLTYSGTATTAELDLSVAVTVEGETSTTSLTTLNPRVTGGAPLTPPVVVTPTTGVLDSSLALWVSLAAGFLAVALLLGVLFLPTSDREVSRTLRGAVQGTDRDRRRGREGMSAKAVSDRATAMLSRVPTPEGYDERMQARIDRAGWGMRSTEFIGLRVMAVVAGVAIGWGLLASLPVGIIAGVTGWALPNVILTQRVAARKATFLAQLPDTLQLMSGALKAGYGILQAIDTIVQETGEPTSSEFQRVLTEARLGLPLEDALEAMAERLDSDDFRWVAVAINIQRRVGGNLAELLETVAATLREREMVRRQIQVLSAEGRLSAVILTLLPVFLAVYMFVVSRDYIGVLFERLVGFIMIGGAVALMVIGVLWMRKLINIDV